MLQDLEFRYREAQDLRPLIIEKQSGLCAAGILSKGQDARVWILLNARFEPRIKVMPAASYEISTKDLAEISSKCEIGEYVRADLEAHLSDEP
ncbi:hypothetical protein FKV24_006120 [Lysobacter maris]|uniref:Uncharacterized protein n=1 Tax=Marilutibacter maris TaxID=1605891 RepID=A0A508AYL6_9GAMM|nr:hypothetical protein [Lysobacter maris]KAB8193913.1 hypothetical protein FKV24_006120 [Lysobacter maris]